MTMPPPPQGKLLVVLTSLRAEGTPQLVLDLCRAWRARNIRPLVLTLCAEPADLAREYADAGIPVVTLDWAETGRLRYLRLVRETRRLCRKESVAGVISMPFGWHLFVAIGARLAGVKRVVAHVGNYPQPARSRAWFAFRAEVQLARPFTSALACCSDYVREGAISAFGVRRSETVTVPNGINIADWPARPHPAPEDGDGPVRIGMVATLEAHKDQASLIRAMKILHDGQAAGPPPRLLLLGEGSRRAELEKLVDSLGLVDCVDMPGSRRDIAELLRSLDIFAFSTTAREGQGIALVEAMAAGLPIVASDVGACREVLDGGRCGLLVAPADPQALALALRRLIDDRALAARLADNAGARVRSAYDITHTARRYAELCGLAAEKRP